MLLYCQQDDTKNVWSLVFCIFTLSCALMPHLLVFLYVKELLYAPAWIALSCVSTTFYQYMGTTPNSHLRKFTRCSKGYYCWCLFNVLLRQSMLAARIKNEMLMSAFRDVVVYCCCLCYTVSQQINNSSLLNVVTSRVDQKGCGLRKDRFYMNIKSS